MVKLDLESKYSAPIKTALNKTEVNPYNQQPIKQDLKPMPKADFVPLANFVKSLPKQEEYIRDVGIQAVKSVVRKVANIPSAITYSAEQKIPEKESVQVGFSDVKMDTPKYEPMGTVDLNQYKSVKDSMESKYDYDYMPENTKKAYESVVDTILKQDSVGKTYEEQRQSIQNLYLDKPMPEFVQKRLANIDSKETEHTLKLENARQNLVKMVSTNTVEQLAIEKKYENEPIIEGTKLMGKVMGSIIQMSPYMIASAAGGVGGVALSTIAGTGTMYVQVYTDAMAQALAEGATREQATEYAHASAMIEAGTEMLSGGIPFAPKGILSSGIQGKIDDAVKVFVKDGTVRKFISTGVDVFGEGAEEALAEYLGSMAMTIYKEDERTDDELNADIIESFVMGALTSATLQLGKVAIVKTAEKLTAEKAVDVQNIPIEQANKVMNDIALRSRVAQEDGMAYEIKELNRGENGYYDNKNNKIVLNKKDVEENGLIESALPHEVTHALEKFKGYDELANFALQSKLETLDMSLEETRAAYQEKFDEIHETELANGNMTHVREVATTDKMVREFVAEFIKENVATRPMKDAQGNIKLDSDGNVITYRNYDALLRLASNKPNAVENIKKVIRKMIRKGKLADALEYDQTAKAQYLMAEEYLESIDDYLGKVLKNADKGIFGDYAAVEGVQSSLDTNELVAVHNLSEEQFLGTLELGAFPVPSIAVLKAEQDHSDYGGVSIVFKKDAINPRDPKNKVFASDVYSPVFPRIEYRIDDAKLRDFSKEIGTYIDSGIIEENDVQRATEKLSRMEEVKKAFLKSIGNEVAVPKKQTKLSDVYFQDETIKNFIIENDLDYKKLVDDKNLRDRYVELIQNYYDKNGKDSALYRNIAKGKIEEIISKTDFDASNGVYESDRHVVKFDKNFKIVKGEVLTEDDTVAYKEAIDAEISNRSEEFEQYIKNKIEPMYLEKGISKDVDPFYSDGTRKSWKKLHDPFTLDNVLKALKGDVRYTEGFDYGLGSLRANVSKQFTSMSDIKKNTNLLVEEEAFNQIKEEYNQEYLDLKSRASKYDPSRWGDAFGVSVSMFAKKGNLTIEALKRELKTDGFNQGIFSDTALLNDIIGFLEKLKSMPTTYFEAKPQRAVGFEEIERVLVPENASNKLLDKLNEKNIPFMTYGEEGRSKIIQEHPEWQFSLDRPDTMGSLKALNTKTIDEDLLDSLVIEDAVPVNIPEDYIEYSENNGLGYVYANFNGEQAEMPNPETSYKLSDLKKQRVDMKLLKNVKLGNTEIGEVLSASNMMRMIDEDGKQATWRKIEAMQFDVPEESQQAYKDFMRYVSNFVRDHREYTDVDTNGNVIPFNAYVHLGQTKLKDSKGRLKVFYYNKIGIDKNAVNYGYFISANPEMMDNPKEVYADVRKPLYDGNGTLGEMEFQLKNSIQGVMDKFAQENFEIDVDLEGMRDAEILKTIGNFIAEKENYPRLIEKFYEILTDMTGFDSLDGSGKFMVFNEDQIWQFPEGKQAVLNMASRIQFSANENGDYNIVLYDGNKIIVDETFRSDGQVFDLLGMDLGGLVVKNANEITKTIESFDGSVQTELKEYGEYSNQLDNTNRQLTKAQADYFKDSVIRDYKGNLKVVYHGTPSEFTEFDYQYLGRTGLVYGPGFYFTDNILTAHRYTNDSEKIIRAYVDVKNPADKAKVDKNQVTSIIEELAEANDMEILQSYGNPFDDYKKTLNKAVEVYSNLPVRDMIETLVGDSNVDTEQALRIVNKHTGIDGVIANGLDGVVYVPFFPEQIKDINNPNPTSSRDIQYSIELDSTNRKKIDLAVSQFGLSDLDNGKYIITDGSVLKDGEVGLENILIDPKLNQAVVFKTPTNAQYEQLKAYFDGALGRQGDSIYLELHDANGKVIYKKYPIVSDLNKVLKDIEGFYTKPIVEKDNQGTVLTDSQREYFKNSKIRDENGNLMTVYHGTPNGSFTKFRSGSYFTSNKEYAEVYQSPNASSISVKKGANDPKLFEVYLDIKKPFDTRNEVERNIFMNEYYRKYGMGSELTEKGLPDWLDGVDLQEFLEEKGYDYDGLILDEGATGGYGGEVVSRGISYVVFNPSQVKEVTNVQPTPSEDIRYSLETNHKYIIDLESLLESKKEDYDYSSKYLDTNAQYLYENDVDFRDEVNAIAEENDIEVTDDLIESTFVSNRDGLGDYEKSYNEYKNIESTLERAKKGVEVVKEMVSSLPSPLRMSTSRKSLSTYLTYNIQDYDAVVSVLPEAVLNTDFEDLGDTFEVRISDHGTGYGVNIYSGEVESYGKSDVDQRIQYSIESEKLATSRYQQNALEASNTQEVKDNLEKRIANGSFSYVVVADRDSIERANAVIGNDLEGAYTNFKNMINSNLRMTKDDLVRGQLILKRMEKSRRTEEVVGLIQDIAILGTELGQQVQALSLIKRMTPEGKLLTTQRTLNRMKQRYQEEGKNISLEIPKEYQEFFVEAQARTMELEEQRQSLETQVNEIANLEAQIKELSSKLDPNIQAQYDDLVTQIKDLEYAEAEQSRLESKLEVLNKKLESYQGTSLESDLQAVTERIKDTQAQIKENNKNLAKLTRLSQKYDSMLSGLESVDKQAVLDLNEKIKTVKKAEKQLKKLIKENEAFTSSENIDAVMDEMKVKIAEQLPVGWEDLIRNFRYLSMLGNPRTHVRNFIGNAAMMPLMFSRDILSSGLQQIFIPEDQRTKTFFASKEAIEFAKNDYIAHKKEFSGSQKYDMQTEIERERKIFTNKYFAWLEPLREKNFAALEWGDDIYVGRHYERQLAKFITARNIDPKTATEEQLYEARAYAIQEAYKATFKDESKVANALNALARKGGPMGLAIEAVVPFKKTPINIVKRGIEYSPIGLAQGLTLGLMDVKKGKISSTELIDRISAGLTGTGVALMGALMYSLGFIEIGSDDEETKRVYGYMNALGRQRYSIKIGDGSYSIDWIAPAIMPFIMGATMQKVMTDTSEVGFIDAVWEGALDIMDPIFELTMLQGVTNTIQSFQGSGASWFGDVITTMAANYVNQYIPTVLGQIARTVDPIQRSTQPDATGTFSKFLETTARKIGNKIPYVSMMNAPVITSKGETVSASENPFMRAFLNMASPGYYKKENIDVEDVEILKLYELTKDTSVLPRTAEKYFRFDNETIRLGNEGLSKFQETMGKNSYDLLGELIKRPSFDNMDDGLKIEIMSEIYDFAYEQAKDEYLTSIGKSYTEPGYLKTLKAQRSGINVIDYLLAKNAFAKMSGDDKKEQFTTYLKAKKIDLNTGLELIGGYKVKVELPDLNIKGLKKLK